MGHSATITREVYNIPILNFLLVSLVLEACLQLMESHFFSNNAHVLIQSLYAQYFSSTPTHLYQTHHKVQPVVYSKFSYVALAHFAQNLHKGIYCLIAIAASVDFTYQVHALCCCAVHLSKYVVYCDWGCLVNFVLVDHLCFN